jgi:hypothetical protein
LEAADRHAGRGAGDCFVEVEGAGAQHIGAEFFLASLAVLGLGFGIFSKYLFRHGIWLDSVAIVIGVFVHQVWEEFEKIEEHEEKIESQEHIIARLRQQIEDAKGPAAE